MAPFATPTSSSTMKPTLTRRKLAPTPRTHSFKKKQKQKQKQHKNQEISNFADIKQHFSSSSSSSQVTVTTANHDEAAFTPSSASANSTSCCSTPKGQKFRIPEISTCPPAPKKKNKLSSHFAPSPISFFAPPDLELFFFLALPDNINISL